MPLDARTSPVEDSLAQFRSAEGERAERSPARHSADEYKAYSIVECRVLSQPLSESPHGIIRIEVRHDMAPNAANAFVARVKAGFYDGCFM